LFLHRRLFHRSFKALHCNWRQFPIVDRLYFCAGALDRTPDAPEACRAKQS
jgi:hypothetical protein